MKILLVDDSAAVRASFGELVGSLAHVELVGCAGDVASALSTIAARRPDLVVLDVDLGRGGSGTDLLRQVAHLRPALQVVVLSDFTGKATQGRWLAAGAAACFDKSDEFRQALDWIAARAAAAPGA